jgi:hypothetical protein
MILSMVRRIIRIVLSPRDEWQRIAGGGWAAALAYAALLSLIPAAASLAMQQSSDLPLANPALATYAAFTIGILFVAVAFFFLSGGKAWAASLKVAAYGATPVLIASALLVHPVLVMVPTVAMLHVFYLYYLGVQALLGVPESDAAIFVAMALAAGFVASTLGGAAAGAMGLL